MSSRVLTWEIFQFILSSRSLFSGWDYRRAQDWRVPDERKRLLADRAAAKLVVIGGGPLACEPAQAFRRLGSEV